MKIYTKTGDKGTTSLVGGQRVSKDDIRLNAYGTVDELNSFLGLLRAKSPDKADSDRIFSIQNKLFAVGANLATDRDTTAISPVSIVENVDIEWLECQSLPCRCPPCRARDNHCQSETYGRRECDKVYEPSLRFSVRSGAYVHKKEQRTRFFLAKVIGV